MNNLSIFLEHIFEAAEQSGITIEQALMHAKNCGIDYLDCDCWRLEDKERTKALFDRCGIGVSCIYQQFDLCGDAQEISEKRYRSLFETAVYFGCDKVLCIPGFSETPDKLLKQFSSALARMCGVAEEYGVTVTVEDFDDIKSPCCRTEWLKYLLENTQGLKYTFDTGNFRYCLEETSEALKLLKPYIVHVHCKDRSYDCANSNADDSNGKADLSGEVMYPEVVGEGVVGMHRLIAELLSDGYTGTYAIEHFGSANQLEYMEKSAYNLRRMIENGGQL